MAQELVRKDKLWRYAVDNFIRISSQIQNREYINYIPNKIDRQCYDAFYNHYVKEKCYIGEDFILRFIEFGFQSWYNNNYKDKIERVHSKGIRMSWILSVKAIKRWDKLNNSLKTKIVKNDLKKKYNISEKKQKQNKNYITGLTSVRKSEEVFKDIGFNTDEGFSNCLHYTTLYNHESEFCKKCNFKDECIVLLKENFCNIYKLRGYGNC